MWCVFLFFSFLFSILFEHRFSLISREHKLMVLGNLVWGKLGQKIGEVWVMALRLLRTGDSLRKKNRDSLYSRPFPLEFPPFFQLECGSSEEGFQTFLSKYP